MLGLLDRDLLLGALDFHGVGTGKLVVAVVGLGVDALLANHEDDDAVNVDSLGGRGRGSLVLLSPARLAGLGGADGAGRRVLLAGGRDPVVVQDRSRLNAAGDGGVGAGGSRGGRTGGSGSSLLVVAPLIIIVNQRGGSGSTGRHGSWRGSGRGTSLLGSALPVEFNLCLVVGGQILGIVDEYIVGSAGRIRTSSLGRGSPRSIVCGGWGFGLAVAGVDTIQNSVPVAFAPLAEEGVCLLASSAALLELDNLLVKAQAVAVLLDLIRARVGTRKELAACILGTCDSGARVRDGVFELSAGEADRVEIGGRTLGRCQGQQARKGENRRKFKHDGLGNGKEEPGTD